MSAECSVQVGSLRSSAEDPCCDRVLEKVSVVRRAPSCQRPLPHLLQVSIRDIALEDGGAVVLVGGKAVVELLESGLGRGQEAGALCHDRPRSTEMEWGVVGGQMGSRSA